MGLFGWLRWGCFGGVCVLKVALYTHPTSTIPGTAGIVRHSILNDRRHVLTKVCEILRICDWPLMSICVSANQ